MTNDTIVDYQPTSISAQVDDSVQPKKQTPIVHFENWQELIQQGRQLAIELVSAQKSRRQ